MQWSFGLLKGAIIGIIEGDRDQIKYRVKNPTASMGVRGTEFLLKSNASETNLYTLEGNVLFVTEKDWEKLKNEKKSEVQRRFTVVKKNFLVQQREGIGPLGP
jgi:hypothetical protein